MPEKTPKQGVRPPRQQTDRPGRRGSPDGAAHNEPLSKGAVRRRRYGPGTYGNDQFDAAAPKIEGEMKPPSRRKAWRFDLGDYDRDDDETR